MVLKEEQSKLPETGGIWRFSWAGGCLIKTRQEGLCRRLEWRVERGSREGWVQSVQFCSCFFCKCSPTHTLNRTLFGCTLVSKDDHRSPQGNSRARQRPCRDSMLMKQILVAVVPWACVYPPSGFQDYRKHASSKADSFSEVKSMILTQADVQWSDCK